jgi:hypothetical protein
MYITDEKIINWFTYHGDPADIPKYQVINQAAIDFAKVIRDNSDLSRSERGNPTSTRSANDSKRCDRLQGQ